MSLPPIDPLSHEEARNLVEKNREEIEALHERLFREHGGGALLLRSAPRRTGLLSEADVKELFRREDAEKTYLQKARPLARDEEVLLYLYYHATGRLGFGITKHGGGADTEEEADEWLDEKLSEHGIATVESRDVLSRQTPN